MLNDVYIRLLGPDGEIARKSPANTEDVTPHHKRYTFVFDEGEANTHITKLELLVSPDYALATQQVSIVKDNTKTLTIEWEVEVEAKLLSTLIIRGGSEQTSTTEQITNPIAPHIIPFRCGAGTFDMEHSGMDNARWIYNGNLYTQERLQLTTLDDEIVWLLSDGVAGDTRISNNSITQPIKLDLSDLQGKITYYLRLNYCNQVTGSLADLQGKITYYLSLDYCNQVTGSLADLQGKITNTLRLNNCNQVTGSLADLQGKITYYLDLYNCNQVTGSLADLQGKITYYLRLTNCNQVTGVYTPVGDGVPTFTYLDNTGLTTSDMDTTLINYAAAPKDNGTFRANGMTRSSASDAAVATLTGRGWTVSGLTKVG